MNLKFYFLLCYIFIFPFFAHSQDFHHTQIEMIQRSNDLTELLNPDQVKQLIITGNNPTSIWSYDINHNNQRIFFDKPERLIFPDGLNNFHKLKALQISHLGLIQLPDEIDSLIQLEYLDLSFNELNNWPVEVERLSRLTNLKKLVIIGVPDDVNQMIKEALPNIEVLYQEDDLDRYHSLKELFLPVSETEIVSIKSIDGPNSYELLKEVYNSYGVPDTLINKNLISHYNNLSSLRNYGDTWSNVYKTEFTELLNGLKHLQFVENLFINVDSLFPSVRISFVLSRAHFSSNSPIVCEIEISGVKSLFTYHFETSISSQIDLTGITTYNRYAFGRSKVKSNFAFMLEELDTTLSQHLANYVYVDFNKVWQINVPEHQSINKKLLDFAKRNEGKLMPDQNIIDISSYADIKWNCYKLLFNPNSTLDNSMINF